MRQMTRIFVRPEPVAFTPRHFGINVETQDHHATSNVWDWIAESGVTVVREFHPEQNLRTRGAAPGDFGSFSGPSDRAAFERFRARVVAEPEGTLAWDAFAFGRQVPWMGVPDGIVEKVSEIAVQPLISLGWAPKHFPRPLVRDISLTAIPTDGDLDWEAAACAYAFYAAFIYHFAGRGARYFTMINEPENRFGWFYAPAEFEAVQGRWWYELYWDDEDGRPATGLGVRYIDIISTQYAAMARLARMALDDMARVLKRNDLKLSGPTAVMWEPFARKSAEYMDIVSFHFYHPDENAYPLAHGPVADLARGLGKTVGMTEFNRLAGGLEIDQLLFSFDRSLDVARLLLHTLQLTKPGDPELELMTFYLLHFPSTHRNYKHLLYGDMNTLDWTGRDTPLMARGDAWYPTAEELQIRHVTPAFDMFRMLSRCVKCGSAVQGPHRVYGVGMNNPTSAASQDIYARLEFLIVEQPEMLILTVLNAENRRAANCVIDLGSLDRGYAAAVLRETTKALRDEAVAYVERGAAAEGRAAEAGGPLVIGAGDGRDQSRAGSGNGGGTLRWEKGRWVCDFAARSLSQVVFLRERLDVTSLAVREESHTPGSLAKLGLFETTRLRAIAASASGERDVTELLTVWRSSHPELVRVTQGGLVQRLRTSGEKVTVEARTVDGKAAVRAEVG